MTDNGWTKVGDRADTWNPEVEKEIMGVYVEKRVGIGPNNSNMYILELANGARKGVWGSAMIDNRMANIGIGSEVRIVFTGRETNPKTNRTFKSFDFFVRNPKTAPAQQPAPAKEDVNPDDIPF